MKAYSPKHRLHRIEYHLIPVIFAVLNIAVWGIILGMNYYAQERYEKKETRDPPNYLLFEAEFWEAEEWQPKLGLFSTFSEEYGKLSYIDTNDTALLGA